MFSPIEIKEFDCSIRITGDIMIPCSDAAIAISCNRLGPGVMLIYIYKAS